MKSILLTLLLFTSAGNAFAEGHQHVLVHITGFVNKPGRYKVIADASPKAISESCAGFSAFGAPTRVHVIRLARPGNPRKGIPKREKTDVFIYNLRDEKLIPLKSGDIIFVPQKRILGR